MFSVFVLRLRDRDAGHADLRHGVGAYQVTLVGAFVPLVLGLYWKRATTQGAVLSIVLGIGTWLLFLPHVAAGEAFPAQLAGF